MQLEYNPSGSPRIRPNHAMSPRKIHTLHCPPRHPSSKPPLLFIHGGYVHAGCWDVHFLPWFAAQGYDCYAIDLSGHGRSEGRDRLDSFGLDDYSEDAVRAVESLEHSPIVIGHSMGAAIVEQVVVNTPVKAAVLLSPVPTIGTIGAVLRLASQYPRFFIEMNRLSDLEVSEENLKLMRDIYFSPQMPPKDLITYTHLIQEESQRAVIDILMLGCRFPPARPRLPVLVMGGELDLLFPPSLLPFVARRWQAELQVLPGTAHVLMLDVPWQITAQRMLDWMRRQRF